jgi:Flp pilus assembly protein TadG
MKELTMDSKRTHATTRGQTLVLLALALVPMIGMAGLGVDVGRMYTTRRHAQEVADIAVAAGAHEQMRRGSKASFADVVKGYATRNGFTSATGDVIVTNSPPTSGPYQGDTSAYEVIIKRPVTTSLLRILGSSATTVQGRAVALVKKTGIGIVVLEPTKKESFKINKKSTIRLNDGTVYVNSSDKNAMKIDKNSQITTHGPIQIVGDYNATNGSSVTPPPNTDAQPLADPLASLPTPPCTLPVRNGTKDSPQTLNPSNNAVLCPGIYFGGIKLDKAKNVTFSNCGVPASEAVFVVTEKGLDAKDGDITADGVMIYNAPEKWCKEAKTKCGPIKFDNKTDVTLNPPTAGPYEGIAIFQDRACTQHLDLSGRALSGMQGDIYAAAAELKIKGKKKDGSSGVIKVSMIVRKLSIGNNIGTDDPVADDEVDPLEEGADGELDAFFSASTGGSARRVVLFE